MSKFRTIVCCSKYNQNDIRYQSKAPRRGALASVNLALPLIFSICFSQNFHNYLQRLSCRTFKSLQKGVTKAVSSLFAILCFLRLSQIWPDEYFLSTGTRKGTKMFNGPANLRKFHRRKRNKSCSKDRYFLCHKTLYVMEWNFAKIYIWACENLAIFPSVFSFRLTSFSGVEGL